MRRGFLVVVCLGIVSVVGVPRPAIAEDITGRWQGKSANEKEASGQFVDIKEHPDGTLTGKWGSKGTVLTIDKGERVNNEVLRWESTAADGGRWVVQAKVDGKSMVLDYTYTRKEDGKIKGGVARSVLAKK